jgi:ribosomal protein S18 acetylase RimI-like enzyme
VLAARVRAAHADVAQREGRLRAASGGGAHELPGIRLMASGLPRPQWNNADVTAHAEDVGEVDMAAVRQWYAEREVPWGVRVPAGFSWPYGRRLLAKRAMAADVGAVGPAAAPDGVQLAPAAPDDLDTYARVDAAAFDDEPGPTSDYARPLLAADGFRCLLAIADEEPAGVGYGVLGDGSAGRTVGIFGIGVLPAHRRRGIGTALTAHLVRWGADHGADLAWLNPDDDRAARLYSSLGFVEVAGFDVYLDC